MKPLAETVEASGDPVPVDFRRRLAELGAPWPDQVITTGGGAVNVAWRTIRANRLGVPVASAAHQDAAYGAALLARQGFEKYTIKS